MQACALAWPSPQVGGWTGVQAATARSAGRSPARHGPAGQPQAVCLAQPSCLGAHRSSLPAQPHGTGLAALAVPLQLFFIKRIADLAPSAMLHGRQEPGAGWAKLPTWHAFLENARLR